MTVVSQREVERNYDVDASSVVPVLASLAGVSAVDPPMELHLTATYFDVRGLALAGSGIALSRRTGGDDDGWHLELPSSAGQREELRTALAGDDAPSGVPEALSTLLEVRVRGRVLGPVATLHTRRVVHRLRGTDGAVLVEVRDDTVTSEVHQEDASVTISGWREWEVVGTDIPDELRTSLHQAVVEAGGRPAAATSKLAELLGRPLPTSAAVVEPEPTKDGPAAVVLLVHLRTLVDELQARDPQVRRDLPDSVHKMRVATRRLRSALATFKPLLDPDVTGQIRAELAWLAGALGEARDAEVMRDRLAAMATDEPSELGGDRVARELAGRLDDRYAEGHAHVVELLGSRRYFLLLDSLDSLVTSPPWTERAHDPAREVLPKRVRRDWKRLKERAEAVGLASAEERDPRLHEVRKAAKRLRYASEALAPVFGTPATALARAAEHLQEVLGDHQDSVVSQRLLRELAARTSLAGDDALIYGRLHMLEQSRAEHALTQYKSALAQVRDKRKGWRQV